MDYKQKGESFLRLAELDRQKIDAETQIRTMSEGIKTLQGSLTAIKDEYVKIWVELHPERIETVQRKSYVSHSNEVVMSCRAALEKIITQAPAPLAMRELLAVTKGKFDEALVTRETRFLAKSGKHGVAMLGDKAGAKYWKAVGETVGTAAEAKDEPVPGTKRVIASNF